jgi:biopolymer transport protein ExbB
MDFHTEIISGLENRLGSIATAARMGPLLGLLGTVLSMIAAFARMAGGGRPDPAALAQSISLGLWTTAAGLLISNPLMVLGNDVQGRMRRLRDRTERQLSDFVEILEQTEGAAKSAGPRSRVVLPR